jgi:hypothetical protein
LARLCLGNRAAGGSLAVERDSEPQPDTAEKAKITVEQRVSGDVRGGVDGITGPERGDVPGKNRDGTKEGGCKLKSSLVHALTPTTDTDIR